MLQVSEMEKASRFPPGIDVCPHTDVDEDVLNVCF